MLIWKQNCWNQTMRRLRNLSRSVLQRNQLLSKNKLNLLNKKNPSNKYHKSKQSKSRKSLWMYQMMCLRQESKYKKDESINTFLYIIYIFTKYSPNYETLPTLSGIEANQSQFHHNKSHSRIWSTVSHWISSWGLSTWRLSRILSGILKCQEVHLEINDLIPNPKIPAMMPALTVP